MKSANSGKGRAKKKQPATGVNWREEYRNELPFYQVIRQFCDPYRFGLANSEGHPFHINSKRDPKPNWFDTASKRSSERLGHAILRSHLYGAQAFFLVNSPKKYVHEIVFDLDRVDDSKPTNPKPVTDYVISQFVPAGGTAFVEPSRSGSGAYVRLLVMRERHTTPRQFNKLLGWIGISFRRRLNQQFIDTCNLKLDNIKGTIWYRFPNPRFDQTKYTVHGPAYEWERSSYEEAFPYDPTLEKWLYNRGVLITGACFGCFREAEDFKEQVKRYHGYLEWAENKKGKKVISEQYLRDWLSKNPVPSTRRKIEEGGEGEIDSICRITPNTSSTAVTPVDSSANAGEQSLNDEKGNGDAFARAVACLKRLRDRTRREVSFEEFWTAYHEEGLNTGQDVNGRRVQRLRGIHDYFKNYPVKSGQSGFKRKQAALLAMIRTAVMPSHRAAVHCRYPIGDLDLAVVLHVVETYSLQKHDDPDSQFSCPNNLIVDAAQKLATEGSIEELYFDREKAGAVKRILMTAELIQCVDDRWIPASLSSRGKGVGKKYGLGPKHPRYSDFCQFLGSHPVVKIGTKAVVTGVVEW